VLDDLLEGNEEKGPGEPDPEADLRDYEAELAPSVRIPEAPTPESTADIDAPAELQRKFWVLVLAFNGALLAGSLGALYVVFRNDWYIGGRLLAAGLVCFLYGAYRLRTWDLPRGDGTKAVSASTPAEPTDADETAGSDEPADADGPTGGDEETAPAATTDDTGDDKD
jgi:hypothetical protein